MHLLDRRQALCDRFGQPRLEGRGVRQRLDADLGHERSPPTGTTDEQVLTNDAGGTISVSDRSQIGVIYIEYIERVGAPSRLARHHRRARRRHRSRAALLSMARLNSARSRFRPATEQHAPATSSAPDRTAGFGLFLPSSGYQASIVTRKRHPAFTSRHQPSKGAKGLKSWFADAALAQLGLTERDLQPQV
jgi:hypothetical protein